MDGGTPDAIAKGSHRKLKSMFATAVPPKGTARSAIRASRFCPLRCQLSGAVGHNNGAHLTKMLTVKIEENENVSTS